MVGTVAVAVVVVVVVALMSQKDEVMDVVDELG